MDYNNLENKQSVSILETYIEVENYNKLIDEKLFNFVKECLKLEELSNHEYEIQRTLKLNKIYFQGYVSETNACSYLRKGNYTECSFEQLRNFLNNYEQQYPSDDLTPYYKALELYEIADDIEQTIDDKIKLEMMKLYELDQTIDSIVDIDKNELEKIYYIVKDNIVNNYLNNNLMDDKSFNICIQMMNDVFNYYISGYPDIPDEFLHNEKDNFN